MATENYTISVENISKSYYTGGTKLQYIKEADSESKPDRMWALHGINFKVEKGDVLGIIGKNGAGKSTLLRILSAITKPTTGTVRIAGNVGSMLEIGAGFSPDLTGRENIFLTGQFIGADRKQVASKIEKIREFSGIGEHLDKAVKYYSSGMYLRLAFSTLTILETDILILDEISAVGDASFRMKSIDVIRQLSKSGRSIVLASHNLEEVQTICNKVLWLNEGVVKFFGHTSEAIENYMSDVYAIKNNSTGQTGDKNENTVKEEANINLPEGSLWHDLSELPADDAYRVTDIEVHAARKASNDEIYQEDAIEIDIVYDKFNDTDSIDFIVSLTNSRMINALSDSNVFRADHQVQPLPAGRYKVTAVVPGSLLNIGMYAIHLAILKNETNLVCDFIRLKSFRVRLNPKHKDNSRFSFIDYYTTSITSAVRPDLEWKIESIK